MWIFWTNIHIFQDGWVILCKFFTTEFTDGIWLESDSKSPQISRTFLIILTDRNNDIVRIISCCPSFFNSFSPLSEPLQTTLSEPLFHSFFRSLAKSKYLSITLISLIFPLWSIGMVSKLATLVEDDTKAPFSRCRGRRYSFPWIAPLSPWSLHYNAER